MTANLDSRVTSVSDNGTTAVGSADEGRVRCETHLLSPNLAAIFSVFPDADTVTMHYASRFGYGDDASDLVGSAHVLEHLVAFGGPELRECSASRCGAVATGATYRDLTVFKMWAPQSTFLTALWTDLPFLVKPRFDDFTLDVSLRQCQMEAAYYRDRGFDRSMLSVRANSPDAGLRGQSDGFGDPTVLAEHSVDDWRALYASASASTTSVCSVSGSFDPDEVRRIMIACMKGADGVRNRCRMAPTSLESRSGGSRQDIRPDDPFVALPVHSDFFFQDYEILAGVINAWSSENLSGALTARIGLRGESIDHAFPADFTISSASPASPASLISKARAALSAVSDGNLADVCVEVRRRRQLFWRVKDSDAHELGALLARSMAAHGAPMTGGYLSTIVATISPSDIALLALRLDLDAAAVYT